MPQIIEVNKDNFTISTDPSRLDVDAIADMLTRAYWAKGRPRDAPKKRSPTRLVFGVYDGDKQIGVARIISDYAIFAYLCDVFIHEDYRAHGLGKWLMETVSRTPTCKVCAAGLSPHAMRTVSTNNTAGPRSTIQTTGWKSSIDFPARTTNVNHPQTGT